MPLTRAGWQAKRAFERFPGLTYALARIPVTFRALEKPLTETCRARRRARRRARGGSGDLCGVVFRERPEPRRLAGSNPGLESTRKPRQLSRGPAADSAAIRGVRSAPRSVDDGCPRVPWSGRGSPVSAGALWPRCSSPACGRGTAARRQRETRIAAARRRPLASPCMPARASGGGHQARPTAGSRLPAHVSVHRRSCEDRRRDPASPRRPVDSARLGQERGAGGVSPVVPRSELDRAAAWCKAGSSTTTAQADFALRCSSPLPAFEPDSSSSQSRAASAAVRSTRNQSSGSGPFPVGRSGARLCRPTRRRRHGGRIRRVRATDPPSRRALRSPPRRPART